MRNKHVKEGPDLILPMVWNDHMDRVGDKTQTTARHILHLFWKARGCPVQLDSNPLLAKGVGHSAQLRALKDLEHLGLIDVERRPGQAPIARIPSHWATTRTVYGVPWKVIKEEYDPWEEED
jgi:hypothetical protein